VVDVNLTCPPQAQPPSVRLVTGEGRWLLTATILGSGLAGIDATVVNIALPAIGEDLDVGFSTLQWTVTAYTLTLASFILAAARGLARDTTLSTMGVIRPASTSSLLVSS
jgi:MFS family permease